MTAVFGHLGFIGSLAGATIGACSAVVVYRNPKIEIVAKVRGKREKRAQNAMPAAT